MPPNRWELVKQEDEARRRDRWRIRPRGWPCWFTAWRTLAIYGGVATIALAIALGLYAYDAPMRDPAMPRATAVVTKQLNEKAVQVRYTLPDGRVYDRVVKFRARPEPAVGQQVQVEYVADAPSRIRVTVCRHGPATQRSSASPGRSTP